MEVQTSSKVCVGVKDVKAGCFPFDPVFYINRGTALRGLGDMVNNPELVFAKHPDDYHFFLLGSFDPFSGVVTPLADGPEFLCAARDLLHDGGAR